MKTTKELDEEINALIEQADKREEGETDKQYKGRRGRIGVKVKELRHIKTYLEQTPKAPDLEAHLETLTKQRDFINDEANFKKWMDHHPGSTNDPKKSKGVYQKEFNLSHINGQIKTLKYILE